MPLALLTDVKAALNLSDDDSQDTLLARLIAWSGAVVEEYLGRKLLYVAPGEGALGDTETFDGDVFEVRVKRFPIVGDPVVKYAYDGDFDAADALVEGDDYRLERQRGRIIYLPKGYRWPDGAQVIQVGALCGGYYDPADTDPPTGVAVMPEHIQSACALQAIELYRRREEPGYKVVWASSETNSGYAPAIELLPMVKQLLAREVR